MDQTSKHFIYILKSQDGRFYTGYTTNLERRLKMHQEGKGAKFTKAFGATDIVYSEAFTDKSCAMKREAEIKKLTRTQKIQLISSKN